jgi:hypothetical protein
MLPLLPVPKPGPLVISSPTLSLRLLSTLLLRLLLELRRLCRLNSFGSCGLNPLALAKRFRISVRLTTPVSLPDRGAPVMADAEMDGAGFDEYGVVGDGVKEMDCGPAYGLGGTRTAGVLAGVGGPEDEGEGDSTTHMLSYLGSVSNPNLMTDIVEINGTLTDESEWLRA